MIQIYHRCKYSNIISMIYDSIYKKMIVSTVYEYIYNINDCRKYVGRLTCSIMQLDKLYLLRFSMIDLGSPKTKSTFQHNSRAGWWTCGLWTVLCFRRNFSAGWIASLPRLLIKFPGIGMGFSPWIQDPVAGDPELAPKMIFPSILIHIFVAYGTLFKRIFGDKLFTHNMLGDPMIIPTNIPVHIPILRPWYRWFCTNITVFHPSLLQECFLLDWSRAKVARIVFLAEFGDQNRWLT